MARIRTIKPDFFRHEGLQDLEAENPGSYTMIVFAGLWGHCDKAGRFEWKPRMLKLDILPFLQFDMNETLELLEHAGFIRSYEADGKSYGVIESFQEHQRVGGKEAQEPEKHPPPPEKHRGSTGEALVKQQGLQEGKGREEEGNGVNQSPKKPARFDPESLPLPLGVNPEKWIEWIRYRRDRKLTMTEATMRKQLALLEKCIGSGFSADGIIESSIASGWQGLFEPKARGSPRSESRDESRERASMLLTGRGVRNERAERDITGEAVRVA